MKTFEYLTLIAIIFIASSAFASTFTTTTGQGYKTWNGEVIAYYHLNPGSSFNEVSGVTDTDTAGTPKEAINMQAFNSYVCSQNNAEC